MLRQILTNPFELLLISLLVIAGLLYIAIERAVATALFKAAMKKLREWWWPLTVLFKSARHPTRSVRIAEIKLHLFTICDKKGGSDIPSRLRQVTYLLNHYSIDLKECGYEKSYTELFQEGVRNHETYLRLGAVQMRTYCWQPNT